MERRRVLNSQKGFTYLACSSSGILGSNDGITWEIVYKPEGGLPTYIQDVRSTAWESAWQVWYISDSIQPGGIETIDKVTLNSDFSNTFDGYYNGIPRYMDEDVGANVSIDGESYYVDLSIGSDSVYVSSSNGKPYFNYGPHKLDIYVTLNRYSGTKYEDYWEESLSGSSSLDRSPLVPRDGRLVDYLSYSTDNSKLTIPIYYSWNDSQNNSYDFNLSTEVFEINPFNKYITRISINYMTVIDWVSDWFYLITLSDDGAIYKCSEDLGVYGRINMSNYGINPRTCSLFTLNNQSKIYLLDYSQSKIYNIDTSGYKVSDSWEINGVPYTKADEYGNGKDYKSRFFSILNVDDVLFTVTNRGDNYSTMGYGSTGPYYDTNHVTTIGDIANSYVSVDGGHTWHDTGYPISQVIKLK